MRFIRSRAVPSAIAVSIVAPRPKHSRVSCASASACPSGSPQTECAWRNAPPAAGQGPKPAIEPFFRGTSVGAASVSPIASATLLRARP